MKSIEIKPMLEEWFEQILEGVVEEPEFAPYRDFSAGAITRTNRAKVSVVDDSLLWLIDQGPDREPLELRVLRMARSHVVNRRMAFACGILLATSLITAAALIVAGGSTDGALQNRLADVGLLFGAAFAVAVATTRGAKQDVVEADGALFDFDNEIRADAFAVLRERIRGEYSIALQDELREHGVLRFPKNAPRLIELSDPTIVTSRSIDRVQQFVENHETSAIGIAGPRGVGKTTLLRAVAARVRSRGGVAAIVSAPVEYAPADLLRSLAMEVHEQFAGDAGLEDQKRRRSLGWLGAGLASVGVLTGIAASVPGLLSAAWITVVQLSPFILSLAFIVLGSFLWLLPRWVDEERDNALADLTELVRDLEYETTHTGGITAKGFSFGEFTMNRSSSRRTLTHSDMAVRLRKALLSITENGTRVVVVAVDELDKLPSHEAAIRTVNVLKDMMRIRGVHVLVTVSDEALASFALGAFERDAFDSTFDAIFDVERLTLPDATRLLSSRVVGFPDKLLTFCFISSAGLARDLLREARAMLDRAADARQVMSWAELTRSLILMQAQMALSAYARTGEDLAQVPRGTAAFEKLRERDHSGSGGTESLDGLGDELASRYARAVIQLSVVDWLEKEWLGEDDGISPVLNQLRDTVLLASRRGGAEIALENLETIRTGLQAKAHAHSGDG
ncbi:AAA family ATPase [Microbacterium sp.]|uniref:AAA family ATPase n=1 Tax=Microbacterium sp. TaxID=51671 RepID=UPI0035684BA9